MKTKIGVIRGASEKEVKSKKFNIYVGISLGNKWFTKTHIKEYILWALKYTKEKVGILIADRLHAINYEVRNKETPEKSIKRAVKEGDKFREMIKEIISELSKEQKKKIQILRWKDVKKDKFNKEFIPFFLKEFKRNEEFRSTILKIVEGFLKKDSKRFNQKEKEKLCGYILLELPELLHGFTFNKTYYNCYIYPVDMPLGRMIEKIQNKELFPHFHKKLNIKNNILVELKIE